MSKKNLKLVKSTQPTEQPAVELPEADLADVTPEEEAEMARFRERTQKNASLQATLRRLIDQLEELKKAA